MHAVNERHLNSGLLIMRLGMAATLLVYALPRLLGGSKLWFAVGKELRFLHADFPDQVAGLVLLSVEVLASVGLITGGLFRISTALLAMVYSLHFFNFLHIGYRTLPLYAAALAVVSIGLMLVGPGRFSVAVKIEKK
jgi:putative oxidoreductase